MSTTSPQVVSAPGSYTVIWTLDSTRVRFAADKLRGHSDGRLQARVKVTATLAGGEEVSLHDAMLNLTATRSRREVSKAIEERISGLSSGIAKIDLQDENWNGIVEESCRLILEREEQGSPVEQLVRTAHVDVEYLVRPLQLDHLPVLLYAPGGSGKSYVATYLALMVHNGLHFQGQPTRQTNVLYLDWEVTPEEAARRCTKLENGLQHTCVLQYPLYRRCTCSLVDDVSEIAKVIAQHDVGYVIVDSAGPACGGDIMSGELAIQLFNALRKATASTNAAVCILTHTTKADRREENQRRLPIGSIYFENLARATWEIRPQESTDSHTLRLGVFPRKQNMARPDPVGLRFSFSDDVVFVDDIAVSDVMTEQGATRATILDELRQGAATIRELTDAVGANPATVRKTLQRLKDAGVVVSTGRGVYELPKEAF